MPAVRRVEGSAKESDPHAEALAWASNRA